MAIKKEGILRVDWSKHPSTLEGFVPVWGSTREAVADWHDGDYLGAVGNGILAVSDAVPAGALGKVAVKATIRGARKLAKEPVKEALRGVVRTGGARATERCAMTSLKRAP